MTARDDDEDEVPSTAALQDAQSIVIARRRAEEGLRRESEWTRITLASIGDGVISTDADGRITFMNGVAEQLTGWSATEAIGKLLPEVFHIVNEQSRLRVDNPALVALRRGTIVGMANHTLLIARDGTERPIDDSAAPIRDDSGVLMGAVLVFRDVSERKSSELMQAHLAAIVEYSDDAIISKTLDGVIRSWNAGAERLFGHTSEEAVGQSIEIIIPPERRDEEHEILARIAGGDRVEHFETKRVTKSGGKIDISLTISPIRNAMGHIIGASKVARDITDRKRGEAALREADRRKDQFIALLAHELRNPLAPLRNGLQVIRLAEGNPIALNQAREMMERQLGHMVRLIDDLLDIARISQNKMELRQSRVLLSDIVNDAVETVRPVIDAAGHELTVSLPNEPVYLEADLTRLAQVFSNILTNSAKYTERGGRIWLIAEHSDSEVRVSVRDTGIGIPCESLANVFDMFSQLDRGIERSTGGLGIGLAIVKGLVEMHQGTVHVTSAGQGKGSTFMVTLPKIPINKSPVSGLAPEEDQPVAETRRRILIVDDNRDAADSMATMLRLTGNEVQTAYNGIEAIERAEKFEPHVILMDLGMPKLNGYEATKRIREKPWGRGIIIIALTGWGQEMDRVRSHDAGCDGHMVKPVDLQELEKLLRNLRER